MELQQSHLVPDATPAPERSRQQETERVPELRVHPDVDESVDGRVEVAQRYTNVSDKLRDGCTVDCIGKYGQVEGEAAEEEEGVDHGHHAARLELHQERTRTAASSG